jgi:adenine-specific DNA-methyltransferase
MRAVQPVAVTLPHPSGPGAVEAPPKRPGALGQVLTPPVLVEFILDQAGFVPNAPIDEKPLLEPACGPGAFLVAAARRLAEAVEGNAGKLSRKARAQLLASTLVRNLWGIDVDVKAVRAARLALSRFLYERTGVAPAEDLFTKNIVASDFLLESDLLKLPPVADGTLGFVIGNPPYVPTTELTAAHKDLLRKRFSTAIGRIDLYGLFMERAIAVLRDQGVLSFIVPDKFLHSQTARSLRDFMLAAGGLRSIACFDSHKVFDDAATVPCVFVFQRGANPNASFRVLDCDYRNGTQPAHVVVNRDDCLPASRLETEAWRTRSNELEAVAAAVCGSHPTLGELAVRISAGLATGRDSIYVVSADVAQHLDRELLHPAVRGRDIGPLAIDDPDLFILLPFTFTRNGSALVNIRDYPRTYRYLQKHRKELETRHCVRAWKKSWFDIHDPVLEDLTRLKKVLVPDIAAGPRFAFDNGHCCPLHTAYYIVPKAIDGTLLAAILNSKPIEFLIRMRAPVVKDGFNRYRRQFLIDLPIPVCEAGITRKIVEAADRRDFDRIEALVSGLFRLSGEQVSTIDRHLAQLRYRRSTPECDP